MTITSLPLGSEKCIIYQWMDNFPLYTTMELMFKTNKKCDFEVFLKLQNNIISCSKFCISSLDILVFSTVHLHVKEYIYPYFPSLPIFSLSIIIINFIKKFLSKQLVSTFTGELESTKFSFLKLKLTEFIKSNNGLHQTLSLFKIKNLVPNTRYFPFTKPEIWRI